jgi:glyoxylase-like metal-dependent hydrolase (beta-lactamase superfamily II)
MQLGDFRIEIVPDTEFRLDGGAMFGIVPRVLWEKVSPPDEANRIRLQTNCLFVETATQKILIETGIGEKWTEKQTKMYGIFRQKPFAETLFDITGCQPEDITIVVNTHLHFDHAGGNTILNAEGKAAPQFPNARYFISQAEYSHAESPTERDKGSYIAADWQPLKETGQLELKPDTYEVTAEITMETTRGHNASMQTARLESAGQTLYHFADLIPTRAHINLPWIMGYDLYPLETLANKKKLLPQALENDWLCYFYHDPDAPLCRLVEENGKLKAVKIENV